jgi:uncharacterized protein
MLIELSRLPDEAELTEAVEPDRWKEGEAGEQVLGLDGPLQMAVRIKRAGNKFILDGTLKGGATVRCDRCLEPYHQDLDSKFHLYLQAKPRLEKGEIETDVELLDEDMEVEYISGDELDLDEIVREQVFLSLPMKSICREECRGLCPICGVNRNRSECACLKESGHPAFRKLSDFKNQ